MRARTTGGTSVEILKDLGSDQYLCSVLSKHGHYVTQIAGKDIVGIEKLRERQTEKEKAI